MLSKDFRTTKGIYFLNSPRAKVSENNTKLSDKLQLELEKSYSTLSVLKLDLQVATNDKNRILNEIKEIQESCLKSEILNKTLSINKFSENIEFSLAIKEYNGLKLSQNDNLRTKVEEQQKFNNIRLSSLYFFNFSNNVTSRNSFASVLQLNSYIKQHNPWRQAKKHLCVL